MVTLINNDLKKQPIQKHGVFGVKLEEIMVDQRVERPDIPIPYLLLVLRDVIIKMDGMLLLLLLFVINLIDVYFIRSPYGRII